MPIQSQGKDAVGGIRVLLADDHRHVLESMISLLSDEFEIVAAVENGQDAVNAVCGLLPDVLVLDMTVPILNGFEVARHLTNAGSTTKIIMLTMCEDSACASAAFGAGARGYVFKHMISVDLIPAIRAVAEGRTFTSFAVRP